MTTDVTSLTHANQKGEACESTIGRAPGIVYALTMMCGIWLIQPVVMPGAVVTCLRCLSLPNT